MDINNIDEDSINLEDLLEIDVSGNNITDISFILGNTKLQKLNISNNNIANLSVISGNESGISDLDNLDQINASNITASNELLNAFVYLPELSYIDLTGTNITSITNCFNGLDELTTLGINSPALETIVDSFNDLFAVYTVENIISFSSSKIGEISRSFNNGYYEQIVFQYNNPDFSETTIVDSFNDLEIAHSNSLVISYNDFKVIEGSFNNILAVNILLGSNEIETISDSLNDTSTENLFLADNKIEVITTSFSNLDVLTELNLQNNRLQTVVGLNTVLLVTSLDISNNILETVDFLDNVTGLESLDISNQYDVVSGLLTLTVIDGINNMPLLTDIVMNSMVITSIDGFKDIGIESFVLSKTESQRGAFVQSET